MTEELIKYARSCDHCNKGMNEGYMWDGGMGYACSRECLLTDHTKEELEVELEEDSVYWTEWYESDMDDGYYTEKGEWIEVHTNKGDKND